MNAAKHDWVSCNHDKARGFHTNAANEPPLDGTAVVHDRNCVGLGIRQP